jgi:hypothetical protein
MIRIAACTAALLFIASAPGHTADFTIEEFDSCAEFFDRVELDRDGTPSSSNGRLTSTMGLANLAGVPVWCMGKAPKATWICSCQNDGMSEAECEAKYARDVRRCKVILPQRETRNRMAEAHNREADRRAAEAAATRKKERAAFGKAAHDFMMTFAGALGELQKKRWSAAAAGARTARGKFAALEAKDPALFLEFKAKVPAKDGKKPWEMLDLIQTLGEKNGTAVIWDENATTKVKAKFVDGKLVGQWEFPKTAARRPSRD